MSFLRLTHPDYATDREKSRRNPVRKIAQWHLPSVRCPACGAWASSWRLRRPLPPGDGRELFRGYRFLDLEEWTQRRSSWAASLGVEEALLHPGAEVGPPQGELLGHQLEDFVHPFPGQMWIRRRVVEALSSDAVTGVRFVPVDLRPSEKLQTPTDLPELWELDVSGKAWRDGMTRESITLCGRCGRTGFPSPEKLTVDRSRWDGSSFFHLDENPNIVLVTREAGGLLTAGGFSNMRLQEV